MAIVRYCAIGLGLMGYPDSRASSSTNLPNSQTVVIQVNGMGLIFEKLSRQHHLKLLIAALDEDVNPKPRCPQTRPPTRVYKEGASEHFLRVGRDELGMLRILEMAEEELAMEQDHENVVGGLGEFPKAEWREDLRKRPFPSIHCPVARCCY
ncbi:unnamed protein product [Fusarium venenatum]|uniref:Uncharacterized protein n=1 Tax=Fusarium venenatum TaxID=56646 RepID=A0A2L2TJX7_9HYPO|nr:uncharacterized protein FVRRES_08430 [Fusarium venenatum]CEI68353.1 unnamed protein product [Fusarium venenatum]